MKDFTVPVLIIGLVVAFGMGYLIGAESHQQLPIYPGNYNPTAAMESQGIRAAHESTKLCFELVAEHLNRKCDAAGVTH